MKMKKYFLSIISCLCVIGAADATVVYSAEQRGATEARAESTETFASEHRFYVGGAYNLSFWNDGADENVSVSGGDTSSFEVMAGVRLWDTFRLEANYARLSADWDAFSLTGDAIMVNAIVDARIDSLYRIFRKQTLVPYIGFGAGVSFNSADGAIIENETSPVMAGMFGIALEMGERFALDLGYRYMYMFTPKFDVINDFAPTAHQLRLGARFNF